MANEIISPERIRREISYDPDTGLFTWLVRACGRCKHGPFSGTADTAGYYRVKVLGRSYAAHRLAWALTYGEWPTLDIDHINRVKTDNRVLNLRVVSKSENMLNRAKWGECTAPPGVYPRPGNKKWVAKITVGGVTHRLGTYPSLEAAGEARLLAERNLCRINILRDYHANTC